MESHDQQLEPPQSVVTVANRTKAAKWDIEWQSSRDGAPRLIVGVPNGRDKRRLAVGVRRAEQLLDVRFEDFRVLGDYLAINNPVQSYVEALIRPSMRFAVSSTILSNVPGVEVINDSNSLDAEDSDEALDSGGEVSTSVGRTSRIPLRRGDKWRLSINDAAKSWRIEFSEASPSIIALINDIALRHNLDRLPATLKIYGFEEAHYDDALRRFEDICGAVFFELDLRYGVLYELSRVTSRRPPMSYRPQRIEQPPLLPRFRYPPEALSLYHYGRSASSMPLLQFLAFYQVLEFFFPQYFRRHLLQRVRQEIMDPRFDMANDSHVANIISLASSSGRGNSSEREQLKATINACVDESTLRSFLEDDPDRMKFLGDKKKIKGIPALDSTSRSAPLLDQTSERIYAVRCRIVHTKSDSSSDTVSDLMLPSGPEAAALSADVELVQFLAQKAIIASGSALR